MRVAIIADPLDNQNAGVHVYVRELVRALAANPGEHEYILIREKVDPNLSLRQVAVKNIRLPIGYASARLFFIIPRILRRLKVDAVFEPAHFGPFNLPKSVKRITMIHDLTPILFPQFHRWHSQQLQRLFLNRILQRADLIISNSLNTQRDVEQYYPFTQGKIQTILLGRNESFQPVTDRDFLSEYKITKPYFLYVGTLEPRKNLVLLLQAFTQLRKRALPQVQCVLVGGKGWKNELLDQALKDHPYRNDIIVTGYVSKDHLLQAYSHAEALVYPSIYEGFGFPILEALSCGTNVICPDNSSLPEVGGELAYYYPTHDTAALTDRMQEVLVGGQHVKERAAAGPAWSARFSWADYARRFNDVLSTLDGATER
ncbi:glycosyltransferase family 1 protein [Lewinella sp. 4G2]|uniref:glycosyltransferase family 4 protein n=1 Tax=Lewinella sp. 4G2 TaxID=1803372 RepID=UPI0007B4DD0E|nr:glycosyltransferase family 1 protein [Lewinella sp. 4G2]OAV44830.1 hypothetical protein A3850_010160 [Lewinella sp. 4G2]